MLADVKYASCPRCRTPANITREKINEIRMRKGLPVEITVTNFLSFTLHLQPRPAPSSHLSFSLFQSLCWNCTSANLITCVGFLQAPSQYYFFCYNCGKEDVLLSLRVRSISLHILHCNLLVPKTPHCRQHHLHLQFLQRQI